jgi:hypothetical protein
MPRYQQQPIDIIGKTFGRWTAIKFHHQKGKKHFWVFRCACGVKKVVNKGNVMRGKSLSCGCYRKDNPTNWAHGMTKTRFHNIWINMKSRCFNKNSPAYYAYGLRGIAVCQRWLNFKNFKDDMFLSYIKHVQLYGEKQTTLDRFPNQRGNYCKNNCRWATLYEQGNNKCNNRLITYNKKTKTLNEWSIIFNINKKLLQSRVYDSNWNVKKIFLLPKQKNQYG